MSNLPTLHTERTILRPMSEDDTATIVSWRNDPKHLMFMENQEKITVQSHLKWFHNKPSNRIDYVAMAKLDGSSIGTVNLTFMNDGRAISGRLFGNTRFKQQGYALEVTRKWFEYAFHEKNVFIIESKTKINNIPNINFNFKIGYKIINILYETSGIYYQMELLKENLLKNE